MYNNDSGEYSWKPAKVKFFVMVARWDQEYVTVLCLGCLVPWSKAEERCPWDNMVYEVMVVGHSWRKVISDALVSALHSCQIFVDAAVWIGGGVHVLEFYSVEVQLQYEDRHPDAVDYDPHILKTQRSMMIKGERPHPCVLALHSRDNTFIQWPSMTGILSLWGSCDDTLTYHGRCFTSWAGVDGKISTYQSIASEHYQLSYYQQQRLWR